MSRHPRLDLALALVALLAVPALAAPPSRILWGADGAQGNTAAKLYQIDPTTGAATQVGPLGFGVTGLAVGHDGVLYGATNTGTRGLVTIDRATGAATSVGDFSPAANVTDLSVSPSGGLFGWWDGSGSPKDLVVINPGTAAVTVVGDSMLLTLSGNGLAFCGNTLYLAPEGPSGRLFIINPLTGGATTGVTLTGTPFAGESISALACTFDGTLFGAQLGVSVGSVPGQAHLIAIAAPAASGTVTDVGATVNKLDAIVFDEIRIDAASAMPSNAMVGEMVSFQATVSATSPATVAWDFGDGMVAMGPSVDHAFAGPGTFVVTVTADAAGPVQAKMTLMVDVTGTTTTTTSTSTTTSTLPPLPLTLEKARVTLNFAKAGRDTITLKGSLVPPSGFAPAGQTLTGDVGGATTQLTLNRRGRAPKFVLKTTGSFGGRLGRGSFAAALADDGLTNETVSSRAVTLPIAIQLGGQRYIADRALSYTAKAGKKGVAK